MQAKPIGFRPPRQRSYGGPDAKPRQPKLAEDSASKRRKCDDMLTTYFGDCTLISAMNETTSCRAVSAQVFAEASFQIIRRSDIETAGSFTLQDIQEGHVAMRKW